MSKNYKEILIETDVLVDHLISDKSKESVLEKAMKSFLCFTTVLNSSELYFAVKDEKEKEAVDSLMKAMKVLGLHSRYSLLVSEFNEKVESSRDAVICATAKINKLSIFTMDIERYSTSGLEIINPKEL